MESRTIVSHLQKKQRTSFPPSFKNRYMSIFKKKSLLLSIKLLSWMKKNQFLQSSCLHSLKSLKKNWKNWTRTLRRHPLKERMNVKPSVVNSRKSCVKSRMIFQYVLKNMRAIRRRLKVATAFPKPIQMPLLCGWKKTIWKMANSRLHIIFKSLLKINLFFTMISSQIRQIPKLSCPYLKPIHMTWRQLSQMLDMEVKRTSFV